MSSEESPCVWEGDPILIEYKGAKTDYCFHLAPTSNWGNPWDHTMQKEGFEVSSPEEAVENFRKWIWGEDFLDILQKKRKWLLMNLKYLKGKRIAYNYKPYAEVLCEAIDQDIKLPNVEFVKKKKEKIVTKSKSIF